MAGRYELKDLLNLRASPLIEKPPNLPPVEEWMGPPETTTRRPPLRGKTDDSSITTESFQKRSFGLDTHGRRSATDPERIHLGPPRRSFASSNARKFGTQDSDDRDRSAFHDKTKAEGDTDQKSGERRTGVNGGSNSRFTARSENESRIRRYEEEDGDNRPRRDADRSRWTGRDGPRETDKFEESGHRSTHSRDMQNRGRLDQPWSRREKGGDSMDDGAKDGHGWRRVGKDRDFLQHDKLEAAPEWADSVDETDAPKSHTHEDFVQWMESMKNRTGGESKQIPAVETSTSQDQTQHSRTQSTEEQKSLPVQDASIDKFFAKFEEKKTAAADPKTTSKPAKSRFASIFGTKDESKSESPSSLANSASPGADAMFPVIQSQPIAEVTEKKANDEAFAKLLEMLNKNQTQTTAQSNQLAKPHTPSNAMETRPSRSQVQSPDLASLFTKIQQPQQHAERHTPNQSLDHPVNSRSPGEQSRRTSTKAATEDLLSLLRRSNINEPHFQQQSSQHQHYHEQRLPPGLFPPPPPGQSGELQHLSFHDKRHEQDRPFYDDHGRPFFDDPAFIAQRYRTEGDTHQGSQRPNAHNHPAALFNEMSGETFRQPSQQHRPPQSHGVTLPPGLQRPPGLEGMPRMPPAWANQHQPPHQLPQTRQGPPPLPPPGIGPIPRGMPPFNAMQQPNYSNSGPSQPHPPQRKPTNDGQPQAPPGFGGNLPPLPPPPGFGPHNFGSPPGPGGQMQNIAGRYGLGGGMGLADRERVERQGLISDMYTSGGVGRGSAGIPPGFR